MKRNRETGERIGINLPCPDGLYRDGSKQASCGSSDAFQVYQTEAGELNGYCFSCHGNAMTLDEDFKPVTRERIMITHKEIAQNTDDFPVGSGYRDITKRTCTTYKVRQQCDPATGKVKFRYYPVVAANKPDSLAAYKRRDCLAKDFLLIKDKKSAKLKKRLLFGQSSFREGNRRVIITEGEEDAMAAYQMINEVINFKVPCSAVSIADGAGSIQCIRDNLEWLESHEEVYLCMDADEHGDKAVLEIGSVLSPGKCKVIKLDRNVGKDACDYLAKGGEESFKLAFNTARTFAPDGLKVGSEMWEEICEESNLKSVPYPWHGLNSLTRGQREGEVVTWVAGSGVAKTTVVRAVAHSLLEEPDEIIGCLFLEETGKRTGLGLMSLEVGRPMHLPETRVSIEEKRRAFDATLGSGRVYFYDSLGSRMNSTNIDSVRSKMMYMKAKFSCTTFFLDHISIMVSGGDHGDERKALDEIATKLKTFAMEEGIKLHIVCHLRRPDGTPHEEGGQTRLGQLRGSAGVGQLSDMVIGIERNGQHPDPLIRNTNTLRVLKNRFTGETGECCYLYYDRESGMLNELDEHPEEEEDDES